ncbi:MAG: hypothetical protein BWY66_01696 [bacterium ADurb.Bin374]|nr:MAG: hypothetical protein BWY66_01696 [bacterium ADurb.Bin374]
MARRPIFSSRSCSQRGLGPTFTLRTSRAPYRGQRSESSIVTLVWESTSPSPETPARPSRCSGRLKIADSSRAMPRWERASPRFGVTLISKITSSMPRAFTISSPMETSAGRIQSPSCSSLMPSSRRLHIMPNDSSPRIFALRISKPVGSDAPIVATGTLLPASQLGAPQTIFSGSAAPTFTVQIDSLSALGWGPRVRICPTTTLERPFPGWWIDSTSMPAICRASAICSGETWISI